MSCWFDLTEIQPSQNFVSTACLDRFSQPQKTNWTFVFAFQWWIKVFRRYIPQASVRRMTKVLFSLINLNFCQMYSFPKDHPHPTGEEEISKRNIMCTTRMKSYRTYRTRKGDHYFWYYDFSHTLELHLKATRLIKPLFVISESNHFWPDRKSLLVYVLGEREGHKFLDANLRKAKFVQNRYRGMPQFFLIPPPPPPPYLNNDWSRIESEELKRTKRATGKSCIP